MIQSQAAPLSLYLHIPFCVHRCAYCDFNTSARQARAIPAYVAALCAEIESLGRSGREAAGHPPAVQTVFFGGGTPSLLSPEQFDRLLDGIRMHFALAAEAEISLEANPGTVTLEGLRRLRRAGFNRISFGVQSSHAEELRQLERMHDYSAVIDSLAWARRAGFENLNLDLIFGLPEQDLERWQMTLRRAVDLKPEHLSLYALTIEPGTPFGRWLARGLLPVPDPDLAAEMYTWAGEYLELHGLFSYEISNWARQGRECQHNLTYWRNLPYLGLGAGAHGSACGMRLANVLRIKAYVERMQAGAQVSPYPISPATVERHDIPYRMEMQETMLLGLRLTREGVSKSAFQRRFDQDMSLAFNQEISELIRLGLLEWASDDCLRLTAQNRLRGNQAFLRFVDG